MKTNLRKLLAWMLVLIIISTDVCAIAATLELPKSLTIINEEAFYGATSIDKVVLHDEVTEIRDRAFADSSIAEINLPESIKYIADNAFDGCEKIAVSAPEGSYSYDWALKNGYLDTDTTEDGNFRYSVFNENCAITAYTGTDTFVSIPGMIGEYEVTEIDDNAFFNCKSITSISFPDSISLIGRNAFFGCSGLTFVYLPNNLQVIEDGAFSACTGLEDIYAWGESLVHIGDRAFSGCSNLKYVNLNESVAYIGKSAFPTDGDFSFDCNISSYAAHWAIENGIPVLLNNDYATSDYYFNIQWYTASPDGTGKAGVKKWKDPDGNVENVIIPSHWYAYVSGMESWGVIDFTITRVEENAFLQCKTVESIIIPETVTSIYSYAFALCSNLKTVIIPPSVTSISSDAFYGARKDLTILGQSGSYAEKYAKQRGISFNPIPNWDSEDDVQPTQEYDLTGSVITRNNEGVEGVLVYLYSSNGEDAELLGSAMTNTSGTWQIKGLPACNDAFLYFYSNNYTIANNGYSLDIQNSTILEPFVAELSATGDSTTTFTASATQVITGEEVTFEVEAQDASLVRLVVDGKAYENYYLTDDKATIKRAFSSSGNRSVQFQPHSLSGWGQISASQTITVTSSGKLAKPTVHPIGTQVMWQDFEISWDAVANADSYTVYLYHNDTLLWPGDSTQGDSRTSDTKITIPGDYLFDEGKYAVNVVTSGYNYDSSTGYASFTVRPTSQAVEITDYPANCDIGKTVTINVACYDKDMYTKVQVLDPNGNPVEVTAKDKNTYTFVASVPGAYKATAYASTEEGFAIENAQATSSTVTVTAGNPQILSVVDRWGQKYAVAYTDETTWVAATVNCEGIVEVFVDGVSKGTLTPEEDNSSEYRYTVGNLPDGKHVVEFKVSYGSYSSETESINLYSITKASGDSRTRYVSKPAQMETYPGSNYGYKLAYGDEVTLEGTYGANYSYVTDGTYWRFVKKEALVETIEIGVDAIESITAQSGIYCPLGTQEYIILASSSVDSIDVDVNYVSYDYNSQIIHEKYSATRYSEVPNAFTVKIPVSATGVYTCYFNAKSLSGDALYGFNVSEFVAIDTDNENVGKECFSSHGDIRLRLDSGSDTIDPSHTRIYCLGYIHNDTFTDMYMYVKYVSNNDGKTNYGLILSDDVQFEVNEVVRRAYIISSDHIFEEDKNKTNRTIDTAVALFKGISLTFDSMKTYKHITVSSMISLLNEIRNISDYNDEVYIYIYAHGYQNDDGNTGIYMEDVNNTSSNNPDGFSHKTLVEKHLSEIEGKIVMVLQPCHSGGIIEFAKKSLDPNRVFIVTACAADETAAGLAWDIPLFTKELYDTCVGSNRIADRNNDGKITLEEIKQQNPSRSLWVITAYNIEHTQIFNEGENETQIF